MEVSVLGKKTDILIPAPEVPNLAHFAPEGQNFVPKYGLPEKVKYCVRCTMPNQKPNSEREFLHNKNTKKQTLDIDEGGVCSACRNHESKNHSVDWNQRERELVKLCDRYRSRNGSYDCLIPGSGGKDSFYTSHILKYKYGMNPLTVTWAPHLYTDWGWKNFQAWIHSGLDNYLFTPNGRVHRLLTRLALETLFHPFQPFMLGQMYFAPKMAAKLGIPLVFYGENAAEYGNPIEENSRAQKDWRYFTSDNKEEIFLAGVSLKSLVHEFGIAEGDLEPYLPADPEQLTSAQIEVQYLGYYLNWHPQGCFYYAMENGGFQPAPERSTGTYSRYSSIDDKIDDYHFYTTFIKFGIGRASYETSQEIRNGELDRAEGIGLVKKYDGEYPVRFAREVFEYLSIDAKNFDRQRKFFEFPDMDKDQFTRLENSFRSPHLWKYSDGVWSLRQTVWS
jgi:N-acetyl sugar amidotransferase